MTNTLRTRQFILTAAVLALLTFGIAAQNVRVDERAVRAHMTFLAGDAMQGRGSGTPFERIAAEYVGTQFMLAGLEPAGENGWDGKPGFVRTVNVDRTTFAEPPTLEAGSATYTHGGEMVTLRANVAAASGTLEKLAWGSQPAKGSVVIVEAPAGTEVRAVMQELQRIVTAGAAIVMVRETPQLRESWQMYTQRRISFTSLGTAPTPGVLAVLSNTAYDGISAVPAGTQVKFGGKVAPVQKSQTWNAIGKLTGRDPSLSAEVVVLSSHLDHVGVRPNAPGDDKIYNGADDDASGTVAVIELARLFANGKRPKRTVYFVAFGSEEAGGFGSRYFADNLPFPKDKFVANLQWEMIGRPDPKVNTGELWLTGFERSDLGSALAKRGARLVQDPHPSENFFQRSDNYTLARQGIIAHTVSSFGLHKEYHQPGDELKTIDFAHMVASIQSMVEPIEWLLNSDFRPQWAEGKRP